jgi:AbrB family looped-hinge helix DNA binding protein
MKITRSGQVTIPADIRKRMGLLPHTEVDFIISGSRVVLTKAAKPNRRGKSLIAALRGRAPKGGMSTDEIMALTRGE